MTATLDLAGKRAFVTGASSGCGRAYALALAAAGAEVIVLARSAGNASNPAPGTLAEVAASAVGLRGKVIPLPCDVTDPAQLAAAFAQKGLHANILVNNAGAYTRFPPFGISDADWDAQIGLNLKAAYMTMRHLAPGMIAAGTGSVINITAAAATPGSPKGHGGQDELLLYAVAKAGLNRLTTWMAEELRDAGVAVNALSPGVVATGVLKASDMPPELAARAKAADPEVLGPPLLFLATQTSSGITGQILHSDEYGRTWPN